ncbi:group II intron reverse transcriptase/maturase [Streptomyces mirabilis]|uniref:group II intron reverse transcriptase/maturase n=1 Tax=Streptomyces mirabilis TaxID=68239 RepID=UPI000765F555|nr:group II intron reverse transcriptase/maturase [Streptomyces mirabilis]
MDELKALGKPFDISKWAVQEAWERVKANQGSAGVDGVSIREFEKDLRNNLYKIWNRMSSGAYFPPPVKAVEIPKAHGGGTRVLGVPSVADRVAQTVVAGVLEARGEKIFHPDSYGYRPKRSALDAVGVCRQRCWKYDWVVEFDIRKFFDCVPHDLIVRAVEVNTDLPWVVLYVKRWLVAPLVLPDGTLQDRDRGTPQGSAISPLLANLFLHYAFDGWMARVFPAMPFERYADDAVVHCSSRGQAERVLAAIAERMGEVGLELHPDKTRIVYCKDGKRCGSYERTSFTFLGFTFRPRGARTRTGEMFLSFAPAVSKDALKKMGATVRAWKLHQRSGLSEQDLARWINPVVRGWMQYYGAFSRSALYPLLARINAYVMRWSRNKYRRLRGRKKAQAAWERAVKLRPKFFAQWAWVTWVPAAW